MAHPNERLYFQRFLEKWPVAQWPSVVGQRVLEIGAAQYGHGITYRDLLPGLTVVGIDTAERPGVDVVCDITGDCAALQGERFAAVLCCSVLEHCQAPWIAAANIERHLQKGGVLYVTVPWIWRYHPYPDDYWRMSVSGLRVLFPNVKWERIAYATQQTGEFFPVKTDFSSPSFRRVEGPRVWLTSLMVCMIGRRT